MSEGARRPPWPEFRAALSRRGFRPSRRLGQNFLIDDQQVSAIARDAEVGPGDFVLEVGPGCGFLTVHLAATGARVLAVELDERLFQVAGEQTAAWPNVELVCSDILAGKHALSPAALERLPEGAWHLVSNLPYSVGGPVLANCSLLEAPPISATVLVQSEVADRLAARPGSSAWGPLGLTVQSAYHVRPLRQLGPALFWPRPRVDSTLVRLELREDAAPYSERVRTRTLAARLFTRRRQGLVRVLGDLLGERARAASLLEQLGLEARVRAEELDPEQMARLAEGVGDLS